MDALFVAEPPASDIARSLDLWGELRGRRIRPLLVTALGDIFVETDAGDVLVTDTLELSCERVAGSVQELEILFANAAWAQERLLTEVISLAEARGIVRPAHQVFGIAPHPTFTGRVRVEQLVPMGLFVWHHICSELRGA